MLDLPKALLLGQRPFYRRFPANGLRTLQQIDQRIAVDRERSFIYFRIPKAANSSMVRLLTDDGRGDYCSRTGKRSFLRASALTREEVMNLNDRFFLFTVTREPYSRLLSAYLDKIVNGKRRSRAEKALGKAAGEAIGFTEFCEYLAAGGIGEDPHWYPQDWFIPCDLSLLHHVGRMDTLAQDIDTIMRHIDPSRDPERIGAQRDHRTNAHEHLGTHYTRDSARIVARLYSRDFQRFGYDPEPGWLKDID
ncbi:hypothetical protein CKO35_04055 [Ectothiorhodospira shaposhnikovii]|uniref:sulfotransferase family protein n=1 Tax=Ectothiorhodospira shaposhnikovii TaxID=1054 RepID=UPI00190344F6|nr:sulfotransferase family protein [Ectothiorhodospira shaposhnikovii]MBK1672482.1 hypothetical protein [Ectothiorhodospira shaposhnikovii]